MYLFLLKVYYIDIHLHCKEIIKNTFMTKEATSLKMEKPIMDRLRIEAAKENRSINNYMETVLIKHFKELDKQEINKKPGE